MDESEQWVDSNRGGHRRPHVHPGRNGDPDHVAMVGKDMGVGAVLAFIIGGAGASIPKIIILA